MWKWSSSKKAAYLCPKRHARTSLIAILAAILFPVFAQAREKARQTSCLSNMKQIGIGLLQTGAANLGCSQQRE